ncbi:MAG: 2-oxoacid:acceptor oxidoreductase family protein [Promethearchaeota archaeon]
MGDIYNILLCGVGGQGVVLIGNILREYGIKSPFIQNVVGTETRGVSQREGSVTATARYLLDNRIYSLEQDYKVEDLISPLIPINDAHLVLGLEPLETMRNLRYISEQTVVILNTHRYYPRNVIISSKKEKKYPSNADILDIIDQFARRTICLDFNELSDIRLGNSIFANSIVLGAGVKEFKEIFDKNLMISILKDFLGDSQKNLEAFGIGYNLIKDY